MKLKFKLMLIMLTVLLVLFAFIGISVLDSIRTEMEQDKHNVYAEEAKHALYSLCQQTDGLEYTYFDFNKTEGLGNLLAMTRNEAQKKVQLRWKLDTFLSANASTIESAFLTDMDGAFFFPSKAGREESEILTAVWRARSIKQDVSWFRDDENVYLSRAVYTLAPYVKRGYLIGKIRMDSLCSLAGLGTKGETDCFIISCQGEPLYVSFEGIAEKGAVAILMQESPVGEWQDYQLQNEHIHALRLMDKNGEWSILLCVSYETMMTRYLIIRQHILMITLLAVALAAVLSFLVSNGMTQNISSLIHSINRVHDGNTNERIEVRGHDEIADLANKYNELLEYQTQMYEARYELLELKYRFIQAQISPHFMSNILSSISSYSMMGNSEQMDELCVKTSRYLKTNLRAGDKRFVTMQQEISSIEDYVEIYRLTNAASVAFVCDCPEKLKEEAILSMLLQPLVENALLYGTNCSDERNFTIRLNVERKDDFLYVDVADNGCGMSSETLGRIENIKNERTLGHADGGFGIGAVIRRLHLQYGDDYVFEVYTQIDQGTTIRLGFPVKNE